MLLATADERSVSYLMSHVSCHRLISFHRSLTKGWVPDRGSDAAYFSTLTPVEQIELGASRSKSIEWEPS
jgi:hypothetical protein